VRRGAFRLDAAAVALAMGARIEGPAFGGAFAPVSIDSRTLRRGDLFFAIRGPRFDGHDFAADAVAKGAAGVVVSDAHSAARLSGVPVFIVKDTLAALQALARAVRERSRAQVVAITGSAGKTTTKEVTAGLLDARYATLRNRGNLNNHIGLPISLMELADGAQVAVLELGMNHAGEIRQLVSIARPDVRVWTNVGTAHLEFFGTPAAIADAKAEILEEAGSETVLVFNADDPLVRDRVSGFPGRGISFGLSDDADVRATDVRDAGFDGVHANVRTPAGDIKVSSPLAGRGNLLNVLAAIAVAVHFGIPGTDIADRVGRLSPAAHRGEVKRLRREVVVVDDAYNSSPSALRLLLDTAARDSTPKRRVAFLGEMLELGEAADELHRECGRAVAESGIAALVTVGGAAARALAEAAASAGLAANVAHVATSAEGAALVPTFVRAGDLVLVKGSRGVQMERIVERLEAEFA
jgi:UDP-N-acetylmuramoyl-tripeptide--D-alanyl-D-alanine ligase